MAIAPRYKGRVLLVDDCLTNLLITEALFNELGLDTQLAENGELAVEKFQCMKALRPSGEPVFHMVLMDHQMPGLNGPQATQMIRVMEQKEGLPMTPIIGVTGKTSIQEKAAFLASGLTDWKTKPIGLDTWLALCEQFCITVSSANK